MNRRAFARNTFVGLGGIRLDFSPRSGQPSPAVQSYDVVVYEGTPAGLVAAVAAARQGARVALLETGAHLGGMIAGGLVFTDKAAPFGRPTEQCVGGLSLEFFQRVGRHYGQPLAWHLEPHLAEAIFKEMAAEAGVKVFYRHRLRERNGVMKSGTQIMEIATENDTFFRAPAYIDASYEGDLMAQAGCSYAVGREGVKEYNESLAGVRPKDWDHMFEVPVSAYDEQGELLPEISVGPPGKPGAGDKKVQAYTFRLCFSRDKNNQVPFPKPSRYDPKRYALLTRLIDALTKRFGRPPRLNQVLRVCPVPNQKADINSNGAFSIDYVGGNWKYPEARYEEREMIWRDHYDYVTGFLYFLANEAHVPKSLQDEINGWGLAKDEFVDTDHWPWQLYVREARRLVGDFVLTQNDLIGNFRKDDVIGLMSFYCTDSHNVQRYVTQDKMVQNEGDINHPIGAYQFPYRAIVPKASEVSNLLVPVCASASHIAFGGIRTELYWMVIGQAAGMAAKMAASSGVAVQKIDTRALTAQLRKQGAVMEWTSEGHIG